MDSNTHSTRAPIGRPDRLAPVTAANQYLADEDLNQLSEAALTEDTDRLRRCLDAMEGQWLRRVAAIDGRGAPGPTRGRKPQPARPPHGSATAFT
jgi:hypothetical protein